MSSRRDTRVKEVARITNLCRAHEKGITKEEAAKNRIAEYVVNELIKAGLARIDPNDVEMYKNTKELYEDADFKNARMQEIKNSPPFIALTAGADFNKLSDMSAYCKKTYQKLLAKQTELQKHQDALDRQEQRREEALARQEQMRNANVRNNNGRQINNNNPNRNP